MTDSIELLLDLENEEPPDDLWDESNNSSVLETWGCLEIESFCHSISDSYSNGNGHKFKVKEKGTRENITIQWDNYEDEGKFIGPKFMSCNWLYFNGGGICLGPDCVGEIFVEVSMCSVVSSVVRLKGQLLWNPIICSDGITCPKYGGLPLDLILWSWFWLGSHHRAR